jgi:hypothetical protein|tara:strand:+ start:160 stop:504 length:345 start_codon:yes stop_codon:yes gene_type:complete
MKLFAEISPSNTVIKVALADDSETEASIQAIEKTSNIWKETSQALTVNRAGIGFTYVSENNIFYPPQPYPSWTLNETTWEWDAPTPKPEDVGYELWQWDEATQTWVDVGYQPPE